MAKAAVSKISSDFGMIDVKAGRRALAKRIKAGEEISVLILLNIEGASSVGHDDGVSIEFCGTVVSAVEITPKTTRGAE